MARYCMCFLLALLVAGTQGLPFTEKNTESIEHRVGDLSKDASNDEVRYPVLEAYRNFIANVGNALRNLGGGIQLRPFANMFSMPAAGAFQWRPFLQQKESSTENNDTSHLSISSEVEQINDLNFNFEQDSGNQFPLIIAPNMGHVSNTSNNGDAINVLNSGHAIKNPQENVHVNVFEQNEQSNNILNNDGATNNQHNDGATNFLTNDGATNLHNDFATNNQHNDGATNFLTNDGATNLHNFGATNILHTNDATNHHNDFGTIIVHNFGANNALHKDDATNYVANSGAANLYNEDSTNILHNIGATNALQNDMDTNILKNDDDSIAHKIQPQTRTTDTALPPTQAKIAISNDSLSTKYNNSLEYPTLQISDTKTSEENSTLVFIPQITDRPNKNSYPKTRPPKKSNRVTRPKRKSTAIPIVMDTASPVQNLSSVEKLNSLTIVNE